MKVKVKAATSFMHGRVIAHVGDEVELTKGEADELRAAGLVQDAEVKAEPAPENKMDEPPVNKMDTAPANKDDDDDLVGGRDPEAQEVERQVDSTVAAYVDAQAVQQATVSGAETPDEEDAEEKPAAGRGKKSTAKKVD